MVPDLFLIPHATIVQDAGAKLQMADRPDVLLGFNLDAAGFQTLNAGTLQLEGLNSQTIRVNLADYTGGDQIITLMDFADGGGMTATDFQTLNLVLTNTGDYVASIEWNEQDAAIQVLVDAPGNSAPVASDLVDVYDGENTVSITLAASDIEGDALTYTFVSDPLHGDLTARGQI